MFNFDYFFIDTYVFFASLFFKIDFLFLVLSITIHILIF